MPTRAELLNGHAVPARDGRHHRRRRRALRGGAVRRPRGAAASEGMGATAARFTMRMPPHCLSMDSTWFASRVGVRRSAGIAEVRNCVASGAVIVPCRWCSKTIARPPDVRHAAPYRSLRSSLLLLQARAHIELAKVDLLLVPTALNTLHSGRGPGRGGSRRDGE